jgi:hypothetical protein
VEAMQFWYVEWQTWITPHYKGPKNVPNDTDFNVILVKAEATCFHRPKSDK